MSELTKLRKSSLETRPKVSVVAIRIKSSKYIVSQRGRMENLENQCKIRSKKTRGSLSSVLHIDRSNYITTANKYVYMSRK